MGTVLADMRHVPWHELRHAHGSASQVPGMLSRIAWGDSESAEDALSDLGRWIGAMTVFDSTVATVPFLWELAAVRTVKDRVGVLGLLRTILSHGHAHHPEWTRDAHRAVLAGRATAERLTGDGDPSVRRSAQELLASLDTHVCGSCPPARGLPAGPDRTGKAGRVPLTPGAPVATDAVQPL
ncbi:MULTISPECIES: hypothetical protein [Streptomyces]|nr:MULTISPECIES: hypothetical protein [Streptomyces]MDX2746751.1 hypothetical protein [Streptomyces sp. NRRL_B-2557]GHB17394.1 hypothetical protein GCM10010392_52550 [Streptomyces clavifer]